jgi:DNA-binding response OmpR family regulator
MAHILLVDDDNDLCYMLTTLLEEEGHTVTTAANGHIAYRKFHKQVPDLILLDIMLPIVDGMEVCWRIRSFSDVPIIMISAKNRDIDVFWGLQAGANDYLKKPFDVDELLKRIEILLVNHSILNSH